MMTTFVLVSFLTALVALPIPAGAWGRGVQSFHHVGHVGHFNHFGHFRQFHHFGHFQHFHHFHSGHGCCFAGGFAVGAFTGLALGSAFAPAYAYPAPAYAYPAPVYVAAAYTPPPRAYWYFCRSAGGYYPSVPGCPEPWVPVPAR